MKTRGWMAGILASAGVVALSAACGSSSGGSGGSGGSAAGAAGQSGSGGSATGGMSGYGGGGTGGIGGDAGDAGGAAGDSSCPTDAGTDGFTGPNFIDAGTPAPPSQTSNTLAFGPTEQPFGVSYEEWGKRWFQWALSLPASTHPNFGGPCDQGQSGPVWFLGTPLPGTTVRNCTVPATKGIMVMAAGLFSYLDPITGNCTPSNMCTSPDVAAMQQLCRDHVPDSVSVSVDDVAVSNIGDFATDLFQIDINKCDPLIPELGPYGPNNCGPLCTEGGRRHLVVCRYWTVLHPLSAGQHTLRFFRTAPDQSFRDVIYHLTVQ